MKHVLLIATSVFMLAGCITYDEIALDQAWSACETHSDKDQRDQCIDDYLALAEAERNEDFEAYDAAVTEAEDRQAKLEAMGVPEDKSGQPVSWPVD